ncbi:S8 family serine peptidase [Nocardioides sp. URHA0032]|uniref:S8 family serine peptidase n=1 Tax=Nocardioides sp. URHA0032 TaxID=1380388 RepID=UPI0009DD459F|nr:S8 family serine peptidase [Nocardioides sp. URHA0032]
MTSPHPTWRRRVWRTRALGLPVLLSAALTAFAVPATAADTSTTLRPAGTHGTPSASKPLTPTAGRSGYRAGTYVVVLRDPAAASYRGGISGLKAAVPARGSFSARSPRTRSYVSHLARSQRQVASSVGVTPRVSYSLTTNGFGAHLTAKQAAQLSTDPRVKQVVRSELLHLQDATTSTGYLGLEGDDGVWQDLGGPAQAGKGVVVGVVDTGIAPENPSFAGDPLGTDDGPEPYRDGDSIVFHKSDGTDFHGICETGEQFTADDCTQKIIGARYFIDGFGAGNIGDASTGEYVSPRDGTSHGSHTASTAAGDHDVTTSKGTHISGVTPAAKIAVYKACWSGRNPAGEDDDGCSTLDLLSAIDAAVADGVDVINYSIGGGPAQTTDSLTDQAFMAAATAGIFVAAAGGNSGPDASTLDNAAPWETTVAASTFPAPEATVRLGDGTTALGASITVPSAGVAGSFVYGADAAQPDARHPELCGTGTLDPTKVDGGIVLCDRGVVARVEKSAEVKRAGGVGMVLVNTSPDSTDVDEHSVPTIHVDARYADQLHAYAETPGATVTLVAGNAGADPSAPTPQIAGFSSRGPVEADGSDIIKPDVAAPGVNVLAAVANPQDGGPRWGYMSGTSMASPHVAGLAALYLGSNPGASPAEIKSALMTSATDTVDAEGRPDPEPFAQGNGQVVPRHYLDPGLVYLNDADDWSSYLAGLGEATPSGVSPIDGSDLNLASIGIGSLPGRQTVTRTVTATRPGTFTATVTGLDGVQADVQPSTLTFGEAGEQHTFTVTFLRDDAPLGEFTTGYLTWSDGRTDVRSALAVRPVAFDAPAEVAAGGTSGSADVTVSVGDTSDVPLTVEGLAHGSRVEGTGTVGGPTHRYAVTVPDGATFARFDLDAADQTGDVDLLVYRVDESSGNVWFVDASATDSPDEELDLEQPVPGTYIAEVSFYRAGQQQGDDLDYALTSYVVDPSTTAGGFHVSPDTIHADVGDTPTLTASWNDLAPGPYLGVVRFGDTGISTVVTVDAGTDTPAEPGTPTLTVSPDASGWVARTNDLRVTASGLTPGVTYAATVGDGTVLRTGKASANGAIDWMITITADVPTGPNTLTLTGAGTTLHAPFRVTPVKIADAAPFPWTAFNGKAFARLDVEYAGYGDIQYRIQSVGGGHVYAEKTVHVNAFEGATTWSYSSDWSAIGDEDVEGVITPVMPDGSDGPSFTTAPAPVDHFDAGTTTFTPTNSDPNVVDVSTVNNSFTQYSTMVRYHGCDGRYVVAFGFVPVGTGTQRWNLTGMEDVDVVDQFGQVIATYRNPAATGTCDPSKMSISQNYWATMTATPHGDPSYDPAKPITMEVSNRYAPHSGGFNLAVGEGTQRFQQQPFYTDDIPTDVIQERGPVLSRSVPVPEGSPLWASSDWEEYVDPPGILFLRTAWVLVPALTVHDLTPEVGTPPVTPISGVTPTVEGEPVVGSTLRAVPNTWSPAGVRLAYQWLRDGSPIAQATSPRYHLVAADALHQVTVRVTGTLDGTEPVSRTSRPVSVRLGAFTTAPKPTITGTAAPGHRLTVRTGAWEPAAAELGVVWYRDGHRIGHGIHYQVRRADRHHRITVVVTGRLAGYQPVSRTSAPVRVR